MNHLPGGIFLLPAANKKKKTLQNYSEGFIGGP